MHNTTTTGESNLDENTKLNCQKYDLNDSKQEILSEHITTKQKSFVWNHFSKLSTGNVECNHCGKKYVHINSTSTGNLIKHLKKRHRILIYRKSDQDNNTKFN